MPRSVDAASPTAAQDASGGTAASFTVTLNPPSIDQAVTVDFNTVDGTARFHVDDEPTDNTLTFAPGETTKTIQVPILGNGEAKVAHMPLSDSVDTTSGGADSAPAKLASPSGQASSTPTTTPVPPGLVINDVSVTPTSSGAAVAHLNVTLGPPDPQDTVTVDFHTADNTARAYIHDSPESGTLVFAPGQTSREIDVPVSGTTAFQPDQSFFVDLTSPTHATLVNGQGTATIHNGNQPGVVQFGAAAYSVGADAGQAVITVNRTRGNAGGVSIHYATEGGNAVPGTDYTPTSGTLTFGAGETSKTFTIRILSNLLLGGSKTVNLTLGDPAGGGSIGAQGMAALAIRNPDSLTVINTSDTEPGSLRQAILTANANPGHDTVDIDIPGSGPIDISTSSPLPEVADPVTIDATTEPGFANRPIVTLDGSHAGPDANGLVPGAGDSIVRGLAIDRFSGSGIVIQGNGSVGIQNYGSGASGNHVLGNPIGTDVAGSKALGNALDGVFLDAAPGNTIGGLTGGDRNVISGNRIGRDNNASPRLGNTYGPSVNKAPGNLIGAPGPAANVNTGNRRSDVVHNATIKGPSVSRVSRTVTGAQLTAIVLNFSDGLDPARAEDLGNYRLQTIGPDGTGGIRDEATVALNSASYDPVSRSVTLGLANPIGGDAVMQLTVHGKPEGGLTDTTGNYLAGRDGGEFTTILGRANATRQGAGNRRA